LNLLKAIVFVLASALAAVANASRFEMFYLTTPDCPYCLRWEAKSREPLLASPEGRAIRYIEVRGETLRRPIVREHYPPGYEWAFELIGPSRGVPRFVLVVDGKLVLSAFGLHAYERDFLPGLRAIVASDRSSRT